MSQVNTIGKDYTLKGLIKFSFAPVLSRFFISLLRTLDDSLFISRYCGEYALAAFSIAMPLVMVIDGIAMLLVGVGTKSSILMGEKKNEEANDSFTTILSISLLIGAIIAILIGMFDEQIFLFLGATDKLLPYALDYMNVCKYYIAFDLTSYIFIRFYTISGKPKINVFITISNTILNFLFDYIFIVRMKMGIAGTAYANLISNVFSFVFGVIFFSNKKQEIHFTKFVEKPLTLLKEVCQLGRSSCMTSLALSFNSYIANIIILKFANENGVAAYQIVNSVQFIFMNGFFGLLSSTGPLVSYAYGEKNKDKLLNLFKNILIITTGLACVSFMVFSLSRSFLANLFLPVDGTNDELMKMVKYGLFISPFAVVIFYYNCICQETSASLSNYKVSTFLSLIENVIANNAFMILLPMLFGIDGVWYVFLAAEFITLFFTAYQVYKHRNVYGYGKDGIATFIEEKK